MEKLTNYERETIITFDETPEPAHIFTYNKAWQRHLEHKLGLKGKANGFGGVEYEIAKSRIPMPRAPRKLSPEAKKQLQERALAMSKSRRKSPKQQ